MLRRDNFDKTECVRGRSFCGIVTPSTHRSYSPRFRLIMASFAAFQLLGSKLPEHCCKLNDIPDCNFWIHEKQLTTYLRLPGGPKHGPGDALTALLACMKKGFGGRKRDKNVVMTGLEAVDLADSTNRIFFQRWGANEQFPGGTLSQEVGSRQPRWFRFGFGCVIDVKEQTRIAQELTGKMPLDELGGPMSVGIPRATSRQRADLYLKFYRGRENECKPFLNKDVPLIAFRYCSLWEGIRLTAWGEVNQSKQILQRWFEYDDLCTIEADFRMILMCTGTCGKLQMVNDAVAPGCRDGASTAASAPVAASSHNMSRTTGISPRRTRRERSPQAVTPAARPMHPSRITPMHPSSITPSGVDAPSSESVESGPPSRTELPHWLRRKSLQCVNEHGAIMWCLVLVLASIELMLHLFRKHDIAADAIALEMEKRGVSLPETVDPLMLRQLSPPNLRFASENFAVARNDLMNHLGGYFKLADDDLLHQWLEDGKGYTEGRRVEADINELKSGNRREGLAKWAKSILRHIRFAFNLSMSAVSNIWVCFYALIMKRVIKPSSFLSDHAIWNNVMSLWKTDNRIRTKRFLKKIRKQTKHGFQVYIHYSADDSKHYDRNHHVFIVSDFEEVNSETEYLSVPFEPTFRLVTTAPNQVKSEGYKKNANDVIGMLGLEGAARVGGGCNDNANDAQAEIPASHEEIQRQVELSPDAYVRALTMINGVRRRPVTIGDAYHWGNLGVMHASKGMAGDTVNEEHMQIHHRQFMMSMHSLHSDDRAYSQAMMDRVMAGGPRVRQRTWRERQQRWLVNQRYAAHVLTLIGLVNPEGTMCLVAWGLWFANYSRSAWKRRVGKEVAVWSSMPSILLALHFEAELGNYFEQAYSWHNRKGPFHSRSGFRMMEIHDYYWDFEMAWWNAAVDNPSLCMPKTMEYLENNFEGDELGTRRKQIERGLKMGRDEIVKMTKRYLFKPPLVIIMLTNRKRGPAFLRAALSVLHENSNRVPGVELINDAGGDWGLYIHTNCDDRPEDEKLWYNLLTQSETNINDLIHFWRQFCLNWPILTGDLQRLSKTTAPTDTQPPDKYVSSLVQFENKHPVLFECLYAVFGAMMSNSRLCEQIHGMMRHGLNPNIGMDEADHHRQYSSSTNFDMNEARRRIGDASGNAREVQKKAVKHSRTKPQKVMLCEQVLHRAIGYGEQVSLELDADEIPTVTHVKLDGRRKQDRENLYERIAGEDAKAGRLTRDQLTIAQVRQLALTTKPTNDATFTFDGTVLIWREKVEGLCTGTFWDRVNPKNKFRTTWMLARTSFIWLDALSLKPLLPFKQNQPEGEKKERVTSNKENWNWGNKRLTRLGPNKGVFQLDRKYGEKCIYGKITSHAQAKLLISQYIAQVKEVSKLIYSFIKYNDKGGFDDLSVKKEDIHFLFVHHKEGAIVGDSVEPAELALVNTCRQVDPHYTYTNSTAMDMEEEEEVEHSSDHDIEMGYVDYVED